VILEEVVVKMACPIAEIVCTSRRQDKGSAAERILVTSN
jgi:hypothetical protein